MQTVTEILKWINSHNWLIWVIVFLGLVLIGVYRANIAKKKIDEEIMSFFKISHSAKNDDEFPEKMSRFGEEHIEYSCKKLKGEFEDKTKERYLQRERYLQSILKNPENRDGYLEKNFKTISKILVPLSIFVSMFMSILNATVNLSNGNNGTKNWDLKNIFWVSAIIAAGAVGYFLWAIVMGMLDSRIKEKDKIFYIDVVIPEALEEIRKEIQKLEQ